MDKIAVLMPRGDYESTPCVKSLAEGLADGGMTVSVLTIKNQAFSAPKVEDRKNKVNILYCPLIKQRSPWENVPLVTGIFSVWVYYHLAITKYDYIVVCGVRALYISGLFSLFSKAKIIYNSLELYITQEIESPLKRQLKKLEGFVNRRADLSIIQDATRASILAYENGVNEGSILLFPNSTRGSAIGVSDEARQALLAKYDLPDESKIVIYSGSFFAPWGMIDELLKSVESWPGNWFLLLHSRTSSSDVGKECEKMSLDIDKNIIFSNEPLSNKEYSVLVQGCDAGVALYDGSVSDNLKYVGLSSGKLAQYLKYGLPIIVNELPTWNDVIKDYDCGKTIDTYKDIKPALEVMFEDQKRFSEGSVRAFDSLFRLNEYTSEIIKAFRR